MQANPTPSLNLKGVSYMKHLRLEIDPEIESTNRTDNINNIERSTDNASHAKVVDRRPLTDRQTKKKNGECQRNGVQLFLIVVQTNEESSLKTTNKSSKKNGLKNR